MQHTVMSTKIPNPSYLVQDALAAQLFVICSVLDIGGTCLVRAVKLSQDKKSLMAVRVV